MSSRALSPALTAFQQAAIAGALPRHGAPGAFHNTIVGVEGRQFAVTAARPAGDADWEAAFSAVVARRSNARVDRLLPVVATGCHDGYHWVAYESGIAKPLVADGWRRWPARLALDLVSDVGNALDDAAAFGIVPYELVPASIFIDARLGPLLGDLGTTREAFGNPPPDDDLGSAFTPPEVIADGIAGARSGVYACGALLYALLSGGPPLHDPLTRWRSDLPEEIDLVLARAMARDTLERYRSAAEFVDSARRALEPHSAPERHEPPMADATPRRRRPEPPARPPLATRADRPIEPALVQRLEPPLEDSQWRPPVSPAVRRVRIGLAVAVVALGSVVGFQTGQPDPPARASGSEVAGAGLHLTLPAGWSAGEPRGREVLAAYPSTDWFAGLTISTGDEGAPVEAGSDPVRVGALDMWRDTSHAPTVVRYVLPTTAGPLLISCEATPRGPRTTLAMCERSISTLSLDEARPVPLAGVARKPGLRAAVARLRRDRVAGRAALAHARSPKAQRAAALGLQRANARAARRLERLSGADALATAAGRAADAYGALASSARAGKREAWARALAAVRRSETAFASELTRQGDAG
jgi:hypothetical protein